MKLEKRDCGVKIELEPGSFLGVDFDIYGDKFSFNPASTMGGQFGNFLSALYSLYAMEEWPCEHHTRDDGSHIIEAVSTGLDWDNEGDVMLIRMKKYFDYMGEISEKISLKISTDYGKTFKKFSVYHKDLCYAVAKACTEVLKEYGVFGYRYSTEYDDLKLHQLLYIKAVALDAFEIIADKEKTSFEKEMELLLFDM
ncbi:MAG: hypothetical protein IKJ17_00070 [Clostridia bacterium]|nr:hypothetical protein [Clostridia bacterium]